MKLDKKMQALCGLQGIFLLFNCQTSGLLYDLGVKRYDLFVL